MIGYTLSLVRDERLRVHGAALFFKDLTLVEQAEERERLRDRLAALGEMAATIAHEVKNPLASIEVMAGLVRRQVADRDDLRGLLSDIISEAKMANAIVVEVLEFVRPIRLQMDRTSLLKVVEDAIPLAERKIARGGTRIDVAVPEGLPAIQGDHHQLCQVVTNLLINALEALGGQGAVRISAKMKPAETGRAAARRSNWSSRMTAPAFRATSPIGSSTRFSRPSRRAPAWGWPSCGRSWTRTTAAST